METGQKIIQTNNKIDQSKNFILSIQVSLSGLSFCVLESNSNSVTYFKQFKFDKKNTPAEVLTQLALCLDTEEELQPNFQNINVIHENELSALVPKSLFNEEHLADYLKFSTKILDTDYISYDEVIVNESFNVYVPYVNINNFLYERFGRFIFKHYSTILIETILNLEKSSTSKMYVHVSDFHFEIVIVENKKLKLYNTFEYHTKEDFIYYILFTAEQLQLNPEEFPLILMGKITAGDELYTITYNYVRHVEILVNKNSVNIEIVPELQSNFLLLNSF